MVRARVGSLDAHRLGEHWSRAIRTSREGEIWTQYAEAVTCRGGRRPSARAKPPVRAANTDALDGARCRRARVGTAAQGGMGEGGSATPWPRQAASGDGRRRGAAAALRGGAEAMARVR